MSYKIIVSRVLCAAVMGLGMPSAANAQQDWWNDLRRNFDQLSKNIVAALTGAQSNQVKASAAPVNVAVQQLTTVAPMISRLQQGAGYRIQNLEAQMTLHDAQTDIPKLTAELQRLTAAGGGASTQQAIANVLGELNQVRLALGLPKLTIQLPAANGGQQSAASGGQQPTPVYRVCGPETDPKRIAQVQAQLDSAKARKPANANTVRDLERQLKLLKTAGHEQNCKRG